MYSFEVDSVILNAPSCSNCGHFMTDSNCEPLCPLMEQGKIRESYPAKVSGVGFGSCSEWEESKERKKLMATLPFEISWGGKNLIAVKDDFIDELKEAIIPYGIETIEDDAFNTCRNLKRIFIPESVREIKSSAFSDCTSLKELHLPKNLEKIGFAAFHHCTKLEKINIPNRVHVLEKLTFSDCFALNTVLFGSGNTELSDPTLEKIEESAFMNCTNLRKIKFPASLKTVEKWAFRWCDPLPEGTLEFPETCQVAEDLFDPE